MKLIEQREVLGKDFKIYGDYENPLFKADEVAKWIEHSNVSVMLNNIDEDEKKLIQLGTLNNTYSAWVLTEDGLYEVLMQSRKPIAKSFKKQVKQILKEIRKHGMYTTPKTIDEIIANPESAIKLLTTLKVEREKSSLLEKRVIADKPKTIFADAVTSSYTSILVGDMAKIIKQNGVDIGANRLFGWLRDNGYLIRRKGTDYNMPTQKSMELGLFEIKETVITHSDGHIEIKKTPKVTGKGQLYFVNRFLEVTV